MAYKNSSALEFKSKGFIDLNSGKLISSEKKDAGTEYDLQEILATVGGNGDEIQFSIKKSNVDESVEPPVEE